jgi:undecaprenyl-diphosphatase
VPERGARPLDPPVVLGVTLPAVALLLLTVGVLWGPVPGEAAVAQSLRAGPASWQSSVAGTVSDLTDTLPLLALAGLFAAGLLAVHRPSAAVVLLLSVLAVAAVNPVLKVIVRRDRPASAPTGDDVSAYAYPSGHAAVSAALVLGVLVACGLPRHGVARVGALILAGAAVMAVGLAQLALGRHHVSDLVAGWLLAGVVAAILRAAVAGRPGRGAGWSPTVAG